VPRSNVFNYIIRHFCQSVAHVTVIQRFYCVFHLFPWLHVSSIFLLYLLLGCMLARLSTMKMEAVPFYGTSFSFYQITRRNMSDDSSFHSHSYEFLRSKPIMFGDTTGDTARQFSVNLRHAWNAPVTRSAWLQLAAICVIHFQWYTLCTQCTKCKDTIKR
jgi:hypothetical protein